MINKRIFRVRELKDKFYRYYILYWLHYQFKNIYKERQTNAMALIYKLISIMTKIILEQLIHFLVVLPIIIFTLKNKKSACLKILLTFSAFFLIHGILLYLPLEVESLRIFNEKWNWTGKIFAILGSISFLLIYRKFNLKEYYLSLGQNKKFLKKGILVILVIFIIQTIFNLIYTSPKEWDTESILYQLTMPGIDEEIAYRGIMLGLLTKILKPSAYTIFHPAILVTALLFGMAHGVFFNNSYELIFNSIPFLSTTLYGIIWDHS